MGSDHLPYKYRIKQYGQYGALQQWKWVLCTFEVPQNYQYLINLTKEGVKMIVIKFPSSYCFQF